MDNKSTYRILYFEDEPGNFDSLASIKYGLDVLYATSGYEGIKLIEEDPLRWDAIILDANMPYESGETASIDSLIRVEQKIIELSGNSLPYFVYSAHGDLLTKVLPKESWQSQSVFDKNDVSSFDMLCQNIIQAIEDNNTTNAQIKRLFPEVAEIPRLGLTPPTETELVKIVSKLVTPKTLEYDPSKDDTTYNSIRVVLEWVFRYLYSKGWISTQPTTTNINACSADLGQNRRAPIYIQRSSHSLTTNCNEGSHGTQIRNDTKKGNCPYAVNSTIYDLLNVLHWILTL